MFLIFAFVFCVLQLIDGSNVLFVPMSQAPSHRKSMYPFAETVQDAGHQVTVAWLGIVDDNIRSEKLVDERLYKLNTNDTELIEFATGASKLMGEILWKNGPTNGLLFVIPWTLYLQYFSLLLEQRHNDWYWLGQQDWNFILIDNLFNTEGIALAQNSSAIYAGMETTMVLPYTCHMRAIPYPPAYIIQPFSSWHNIDVHPALNKFLNRVNRVYDYASDIFVHYQIDQFVVRKTGMRFTSNFNFQRFFTDSAAVFTDYPNALESPRPITNDVIFVGNKCKTVTAGLPQHLTQFINSAGSNGTIYLAFGTIVSWTRAPRKNALAFVAVARRLKSYQFLFQYNGEPINDVPDNFLIQKWFPQPQILSHPRTIVFVTHGGLKSVKEGICAGVPMATMPMFAEQFRNAEILRNKGAGTIINKLSLTTKHVESALLEIVDNYAAFRSNAEKLRVQIRDVPIGGPDLGRFWVEFIVKHRGLPKAFFRVKGVHMNFITYFCIDVIFTVVAASSLFYSVTKYFCTLICNRYKKY